MILIRNNKKVGKLLGILVKSDTFAPLKYFYSYLSLKTKF